tara:strand:- start:22121 stop:22777 length:657 start_codon:yes stop_codon:yes gene_type:complete
MKEIMNDLYMEGQLDVEIAPVLQRMQNRIMKQTTYHGVITHKQPLDFWVYQEMIYELKPDVIIEIGNCRGGSTLALAHQQDLMDHGRIIAIDIDHSLLHEKARAHPRIEWIEDCAVAGFDKVKKKIKKTDTVLVIEDSAHTYKHTLKCLRLYSELIKVGGYMIIEDGIGRHGLRFGESPGPFEATTQFLTENKNFVADRDKESFFITWNPQGYLKRIS